MLTKLIEQHGRRLMRYAGVSVIGVIVGQTLLFMFYEAVGLGATSANVLAVMIGTVPSYLLNRAWVWGKSGSHSVRAEIVPFWGMAVLGLILSTALVAVVSRYTDAWLMINAANLSAFGSLWLAKYVILDRVLFADETAGRVESVA
jgi:putative flippase GtrA